MKVAHAAQTVNLLHMDDNTTNMRQHLPRLHPELEQEKKPPVVAANQRTITGRIIKTSP